MYEEVFRDRMYDKMENYDPRVVNVPSFGGYDRAFVYIVHPVTFESSKYKQQNLQVIVKMSAIELTPENPCFKGGSWHLEGMVNEVILATAIYYYDIENITESRLSFRHLYDSMTLACSAPKYDHRGVEVVYGIKNEVTDNVQPSGFIVAKPNRCVVF
jgi:hypothetical protein